MKAVKECCEEQLALSLLEPQLKTPEAFTEDMIFSGQVFKYKTDAETLQGFC